MLSFPFALRATGWIAGLACIALIAATEAFTLYVLSRFAEHTGARSYPALVRPKLILSKINMSLFDQGFYLNI